MPTYSYPSDAFPADPSVDLETPEGWVPAPTPAARVAVALDTSDGSLRPSVAALISRHTEGYPATVVLDELARLADDLTDARLEDQFTAEIGDREFYGRVLAYRHPQAGSLAELHLVTGVEHDGVTDIVHLVGTCAGDRVAEHLPLLRDVISSARIAT